MAAVATIMLAGSQLTSIGHLSLASDAWRLAVAVVAAVVAIGAVAFSVFRLTKVLLPTEGTLGRVRAHSEKSSPRDTSLRLGDVTREDSGLLAGRPTVALLLDEYEVLRTREWAAKALVVRCEDEVVTAPSAERPAATARLEDARQALAVATRHREDLTPQVRRLVQMSSYLDLRRTFESERRRITGAALVTALALVSYVWAANPAAPGATAGSTLPDAPSAGLLTLRRQDSRSSRVCSERRAPLRPAGRVSAWWPCPEPATGTRSCSSLGAAAPPRSG